MKCQVGWSTFWRISALGFLWREWCWSWNSSTLATSCEELTHWKRPWCWEGLGAGGEGDNRGWDGSMASLTQWMWVWVNSGSWWWTGRPGVLWFMGSRRVGHDWATELNLTELMKHKLESRLPGEISITSDMQITPPLWLKPRRTKELLDEGEKESEKAGLKLNIQKWRSWLLLLLPSRFSRVQLCATPWTAAYQASPSMGFSRQEHWSGLPFPSPEDHGIWSQFFMANRWENNENSERLYFGAPKSLQMVTSAVKWKDTCSLEEKLWQT